MEDDYTDNSPLSHVYISIQKGWENVVSEVGSERVKLFFLDEDII